MRNKDYLQYLPQQKKTDYLLLLLPFLFTIFGLLMIFEASNVASFESIGDKYHFVKEQSIWAAFGFVIMLVFSQIHYLKFFNLAIPSLTVAIISLIVVLIPGIGIRALGARRWIDLGFMSFQPSELAKMSLILYLSSWLVNKDKERFIPFIFLLSLIVGLVILQPDLGTAIILSSIFLIVYFLSQAPFWHFLILLPLSVFAGILLSVLSPYRYQRILTFFNPSHDPLGSSYHIRQVLISLGSGGFFGLGIGASRQKYQYLPEATTDSIFAIIGEEFGFFGTVLIIFGLMFFLYRVYLVVRHAPDDYSQLLSAGIFALLSSQMIINLGAMVALFPLTGIPLPFISYGGSNLVVTLSAVGILLNISKYKVKKKNL